MKRKALGKGLSSLLPQAATPAVAAPQIPVGATEGVTEIDIDLIRPNPRQPRESFEAGALEELSNSLKNKGFLQPIVVRPLAEGGFELVVGERRWRAAQRAGLRRIPALVRHVPDGHLLETALAENLQRENLNAIEEAQAYRALLQDSSLSQEQLATKVGKQRATVANALRLLSLPAAVQDKVRSGQLSMGHARAILGLSSSAEQITLADRAVREGLSVRHVENLVAAASRRRSVTISGGAVGRDPNVVAAEENLQRAIGTKVRVIQGRRGGRIEVYFYSAEELERAYQLLLSAAQGIPRRNSQADRSVGTQDMGRQIGRPPTRESTAD